MIDTKTLLDEIWVIRRDMEEFEFQASEIYYRVQKLYNKLEQTVKAEVDKENPC
jgi:hypothetical protein